MIILQLIANVVFSADDDGWYVELWADPRNIDVVNVDVHTTDVFPAQDDARAAAQAFVEKQGFGISQWHTF